MVETAVPGIATTRRSQAAEHDGAASAAPDRLIISADHLPVRDRFAYIREEICAHHLNFDLTRREAGTYNARVEASLAGDVLVSTFEGAEMTPVTWSRSRKALTDTDGGCMIYVIRKGQIQLRQAGLEATVAAGAACVFNVGEAITFDVPAGVSAFAVKVPESAIRPRLRPGAALMPRYFAPSDPLVRLIAGYGETVFQLPAETDPTVRELSGRHLTDLVTMAFAARDAREEIRGRALKAARTEAVLTAIRDSFARPNISAAVIGRQLGITDRQVHRLLEETPKSFYEHVLECRLRDAHRSLRDPAALGLKVADVAFRAGFTDVTYFNRAFKTRFGDTPTGVRNAAPPA